MQDKKASFILKNYWYISRNQPKWLTQFEKSSKRTKIFASDVDFIAMEEFFKTKSEALKDMTCAKHERNRLRDEENKYRYIIGKVP